MSWISGNRIFPNTGYFRIPDISGYRIFLDSGYFWIPDISGFRILDISGFWIFPDFRYFRIQDISGFWIFPDPQTFPILPSNLMKNISIHIFILVKNKKTRRNFFWENYQLLDIAFWNKYLFFRYEKIPNVSHIYIGLLLLHTVTIYFVVLPISNVSASWRNGIASDFDMSGTLPLPWVRVPATPLSFFNFSFFFFFNGLLF